VAKTKPLKDVRKQLGNVADQLDLDKRLGEVADKVGLADRKKVLGIPVSRKRPDWGRIATYGAAAVAVLAAGARALGGGAAGGSEDGADDGSSEESGQEG
jgi:hypothetical protein